MDDTDIEAIIELCRRERMFLSLYRINTVSKLLKENGDSGFSDYLSEWEYAYLNRLKFPKRKADFISGRLAGKEAVINYFKEHGSGSFPGMQEIEILRTETGEPEVLLKGGKSGLMISITHSGNLALSLVSGKEEFSGIGIDAEKIEKRDLSFLRIAFSNEEIEDFKVPGEEEWSHEKVTLYWTLKEAVLKSIGSGLNHNLKEISVRDSGRGISVELFNDVKKRFFHVCSEGPFIRYFRHDEYMISISTVR